MSIKNTFSTTDFIRKERDFGARNYAPVPVVIDRAKDCLVWDVEGREYIDMMSAYSAVSHGHLHPRVVAALEGLYEAGVNLVSRLSDAAARRSCALVT